jgi:hypothetical protein
MNTNAAILQESIMHWRAFMGFTFTVRGVFLWQLSLLTMEAERATAKLFLLLARQH